MLYPSMEQPENDELNDSRDVVSKDDSNALMEEQMSSSQDHVDDGPQKPQHIFVLDRESSLGKREHDSAVGRRPSGSSVASLSPTNSPVRNTRAHGKKKQKLSARMRKRRLERSFGSDFKPGTIRHRLNFLQHNFGDQLALIEESLPQTFHRNMNLETFIKNKAEQHEQHSNDDSSHRRSPSFRRSPERQRKPSAVKQEMSGIQEAQSADQGEMAEIMTFAPRETPHFENSSSNLSDHSEHTSNTTTSFSHAGTFPLDRSAREWRLSKFLEESPPPSPTPASPFGKREVSLPADAAALPVVPSLDASDASPAAAVEEKDAAVVPEPSDVPVPDVPVPVEKDAAPASDVPASVEEKESVIAVVEENDAAVVAEPSDAAVEEAAPAPSDAPANVSMVSATGIVESVVSTPEKAAKEVDEEPAAEEPLEETSTPPKEEATALMTEEPTTEELPASEEPQVVEEPSAPMTEEAEIEVSTPKAIDESPSPALTEEAVEPVATEEVSTAEAPAVFEKPATPAEESSTPMTEEVPTTEEPATSTETEEQVTPAGSEEVPTPEELATSEAPTTETEEPATQEVPTEEPATQEVPTEEPASQEVPTEEPAAEEPTAAAVTEEPKDESEHSLEVAGDDLEADGDHDAKEASTSSLLRQEGVVETQDETPEAPSEGVTSEPQGSQKGAEEAPADRVQEGVASEQETSQEDPVSTQVKESASQIPEIGEDTPSRGESPQVQAKKTVQVEPESKPESPSEVVVVEPEGVVAKTTETAPQDSPAPVAPVVSDGVAEDQPNDAAPAMAVDTSAAPMEDSAAPSTPVGDQSVSSASTAMESPRPLDAVELARMEQATPVKPAASVAATPPTPDAVERARLEQQTPVKRKLNAAADDATTKQPKADASDNAAATDENTDPQNCPSPSSVMDTELEDGEGKVVKKLCALKENRKLRFADEEGHALTKEHVIEREANYASRIVVMLLSPRDRKFEFLHAEYPLDASTTVQVLLEQVPLLATNDAFRTKKFNALLQTENSRQLDNALALQDYCFKESEIVLGIPDDFTVANMTKMAVPLLLNKKLMKTVKQAIRKGRGLKTVQSGEEWRK
ncbi:unnamed protein product [Cylindrotheca closterium]|uniref:Uncharacterized protein n=1 Tax=Cylindrotheca closterium TaxID=2856 RepID=A0AAD2CK45_9STRA|nr:unnamed protein product [Cylindrotheca closterium]